MDGYATKAAIGQLSSNNANSACDPREQTAHDEITKRLTMLRDHFGQSTQRMIDLGARAYGGSPVGSDKTIAGNGARPQATGSLAIINDILSEMESIASLQNDAINFASRIA